MAQRDRERDRQRERRKRKKRKYGQAKLNHAKRGIISCMLSSIVLLVMFILLLTTYRSSGTSSPVIGGFGLVAFILACGALYAGIRGYREREKDYTTCTVGVSASGLFILGFIIIFIRGLV